MTDRAFALQCAGYSLTTAEILYRMPDHPTLLQTYLWQGYDLAPKFPELIAFLDYWAHNLDGPLHTIRVAHKRLVSPTEYRFLDGSLQLH
jgi:uncharacterized protein Usg